MKNKTKYFYFLTLLLISSHFFGQDFPKGKWIEVDSIRPNDPLKIEIFDYYFTMRQNSMMGRVKKVFFHKINDTIIFTANNKITKIRFEQNDSILRFYNLTKDTLLLHLIKDKYPNYIAYHNAIKGTRVMVPTCSYSRNKANQNDLTNIVFVEYDNNNELKVHINGIKQIIQDLINKKLVLDSDGKVYYTQFVENYFYVDKSVKLSDLQIVKNAFRKAGLNRIMYVSQNDTNQLFITTTMIKQIQNDNTETIIMINGKKIDLPPPPPSINQKSKHTKNILCKINARQIDYNHRSVNSQKFFKKLRKLIAKGKDVEFLLYFNQELSFEDYLSYIINIKKQYYSIRNAYVKKAYQVDDYRKLDRKERNLVLDKFPMNYREISKEEYEEMKNVK